ncbi:MAG: hypothetical protein KJ915_02130 [Candidatus Omnitrophica bacterium]|nr:hypothetical protein [Candidatus Omnitrophota bacterium]
MKKIFVIISGVYISLIGLFFIAPTILFLFLGEVKDLLSMISLVPSLIIGIITLCIGIGVIRIKSWARIAISFISCFLLFIGVLVLLTSFLLSSTMFEQMRNKETIALAMRVGISAFLILIPTFFLVFFTRKSIEELFDAKNNHAQLVNVGIKLIAGLLIFGGLFIVASIFFTPKTPAIFFGIMLSGKLLIAYQLIFAVLSFFTGLGLWKLKRSAWITAIFLEAYGMISVIINYVFISENQFKIMFSGWAKENQMIYDINTFKIMMLISSFPTLIILIYLLYKRSLFKKIISGDVNDNVILE